METVDFELDLTDISTDLSIEVDNLNGYVIGEGKMAKFIRREPFEITADEFAGLETIPSYLFYKSSIEKVTIPSTIKNISIHAFSQCLSLKNVIIRNGVETLGDSVFSSCDSLTSITIPNSVTSIGSGVVSCKNLRKVVLSDNIETIPTSLFSACEMLGAVIFPKNAKTVKGTPIFSSTNNRRAVIIPKSVETIPKNFTPTTNSAFTAYCEATEQPSGWDSAWKSSYATVVWGIKDYGRTDNGVVWVKETDENVCKVVGFEETTDKIVIPSTINGYTVTRIDDSAHLFVNYTDYGRRSTLKSVEIGDGITEIGRQAFYACYNIEKVVVGKSVTSIGNYAFDTGNSTNKYTLIMLPTAPPIIGASVFSESYIGKIIVPKGYLSVYKSATNWSKYAKYMVEATE